MAHAIEQAHPRIVGAPVPRPGSRSLRGNFLWALIGNAVYSACQWGILVVLAKLGSPEMLGRFALGLAVTAPIVMFANLHLQGVIRTDTQVRYQLGDYLGLRYVTSALAMMAILLVVLLMGYSGNTALVILAIGVAKGVESISNVLQGFLQLHERMDRVTLSLIVKGPLSLGALGICVYWRHSVLAGVVGLIVAWTFLLIVIDLRNVLIVYRAEQPVDEHGHTVSAISLLRPLWHVSQLKALAWLTLPLGVGTLLSSLNVNVPRYFVERHLGEADLGVFAAMAYLLIAGMSVMESLGESASPRLAAHYDLGRPHAFRSLLIRLVLFGSACGLLGIVFSITAGHLFLQLIYSERFAEQSNVMTLLAIAGAFNFALAFLHYGLLAAKRFRSQVPLSLAALIVTVVGSATLVPRYGLEGASYALIGASAIQLVFAVVLIRCVLKEMPASESRIEMATT